MLTYLGNTLIFMIVGVVISQRSLEHMSINDGFFIIVLYFGLNTVRLVLIVAMSPLLSRMGYGFNWRWAAVCIWSGTKGAFTLSLALMAYQLEGLDEENVRNKVRTAIMIALHSFSCKLSIQFQKHIIQINNTFSLLKMDRFLADANWIMAERVVQIEDPYKTSHDDVSNPLLYILLENRKRYTKCNYYYILKNVFLFFYRNRLLKLSYYVVFTNSFDCFVYIVIILNVFPIILEYIPDLSTEHERELKLINYVFVFVYVLVAVLKVCKTGAVPVPTCCMVRTIKLIVTRSFVAPLGLLQRDHPEIAISVKTRQAIRTVLNSARDTIHALMAGGLLDDAEAFKLETMIEVKMKRLQKFPAAIQPPTAEELLKNLPWLQNAEKQIEFIKPGKTMPVFTDYRSSGAIIGELNCLTQQIMEVTVTCETVAQTCYISIDDLFEAFDVFSEFPSLEYKIWLALAIRIAVSIMMGWSYNSICSYLARAYVVDIEKNNRFDLYDGTVEDAFLIYGSCEDIQSQKSYDAPSYIAKTTHQVIEPLSNYFQKMRSQPDKQEVSHFLVHELNLRVLGASLPRVCFGCYWSLTSLIYPACH
uniref:Cation/H+ exchanger transmembrane domain-containing protein n=1 Tax=Callorhinchus milii TaxID=7868 RepID=A0A4W3IFF8_CALMI